MEAWNRSVNQTREQHLPVRSLELILAYTFLANEIYALLTSCCSICCTSTFFRSFRPHFCPKEPKFGGYKKNRKGRKMLFWFGFRFLLDFLSQQKHVFRSKISHACAENIFEIERNSCHSHRRSAKRVYTKWGLRDFGEPEDFFPMPMKRTIELYDLDSVWLEPAPEVEVSPASFHQKGKS